MEQTSLFCCILWFCFFQEICVWLFVSCYHVYLNSLINVCYFVVSLAGYSWLLANVLLLLHPMSLLTWSILNKKWKWKHYVNTICSFSYVQIGCQTLGMSSRSPINHDHGVSVRILCGYKKSFERWIDMQLAECDSTLLFKHGLRACY